MGFDCPSICPFIPYAQKNEHRETKIGAKFPREGVKITRRSKIRIRLGLRLCSTGGVGVIRRDMNVVWLEKFCSCKCETFTFSD